MKKIIITILMFCLWAFPVMATNTYTTDLESTSSQYWSITDANQTGLAITGDITIEAWINLESMPSTLATNENVVTKRGSAVIGYQLDIISSYNDGTLRFIYWDNSSNSSQIRTSSAFLTSSELGDWIHLAIAVDVSAHTASFYKNGSSVSSTVDSTNASSIGSDSTEFRIGALGNNSNYFDGKIDDVRVYNTIRSGADIADDYNCSLAGSESNLQGYWRFDNNGNDSTSNSNDLTNNNSATFQSGSLPFTDSCSGGGGAPARKKANQPAFNIY